MQNTVVKSEMVLLSVPSELLDEIGLAPLDVIQFSVANGKLIIEKVTNEDFVCNGDCQSCPFVDDDCDGNCGGCPCCERCEEDENE